MSIQIACSRDFAFLSGFIAGLFLQFCFFTFTINNHLSYNPQKSVASSILQSLQSSAAIYTAQQRKKPEAFSDFVQITSIATGAKTITLENIRSQLYESPSLNKKKLVIKFKPDGCSKATYILKGTDVTASYTGFNTRF